MPSPTTNILTESSSLASPVLFLLGNCGRIGGDALILTGGLYLVRTMSSTSCRIIEFLPRLIRRKELETGQAVTMQDNWNLIKDNAIPIGWKMIKTILVICVGLTIKSTSVWIQSSPVEKFFQSFSSY